MAKATNELITPPSWVWAEEAGQDKVHILKPIIYKTAASRAIVRWMPIRAVVHNAIEGRG